MRVCHMTRMYCSALILQLRSLKCRRLSILQVRNAVISLSATRLNSTLGDIDMDTAIPSSSAITAAKEKRDRLRKTGDTTDDFISLSVTKRADYSKGPHPESRLMREDDEVGEGDDGKSYFSALGCITLTCRRRICGIHQRTRAHCSWEEV